MGKTMVEASAAGPNGTRLFSFLIDTGATLIGLPSQDIEALGLPLVEGGRQKVLTAAGVIAQETYVATIRIEADVTPALVTEAPVPMIGWDVLERLRMKVNLVTHKLEKASEDEPMPPFML